LAEAEVTLRAIAWDIDGTLVDSEPLHHRVLVGSGLRWGVDLTDVPENLFRGVHMHDVWTALRPRFPADLRLEDWIAALEEDYAREAGGLLALPGAMEAVRAFADSGLAQVCVSNSSRRVVDANLVALGVAPYIDFSISLDDVEHGKPAPEPYRRACERLGLAPDSVLAVEDSATGLRSARAAGLRSAAYAPNGHVPGDADVVVADHAELLDWVRAARASG
jgi:HAD superfamily hydrolase (TIGR01509 family)